MKIDVLAFGAHPDDVELGCGATIAKLVSNGKSVAIVDLTKGEMGTNGTVEIRMNEAANAASILGVQFRKNLNFKDAFFENDKIHQIKVIELLRLHQPDIVICNAIDDRHIDHPRAANLISDSCFLSGLKKIQTSVESGTFQSVWRPKLVYHYIQWKDIQPDIVVNVSGFLNKKMEAIQAFSSQFYSPDGSRESTPISSQNFLHNIRHRALNLGRLIGVDEAEAFTCERYPAVNNITDLI
jgi:bacillithiol biosynthesis deacetylase BshB1